MSNESTRYEIVDGHTGEPVATVTGLKTAIRRAERLDQEYGSHRYFHRVEPQAMFSCARHDGIGLAPGGTCPLCREDLN